VFQLLTVHAVLLKFKVVCFFCTMWLGGEIREVSHGSGSTRIPAYTRHHSSWGMCVHSAIIISNLLFLFFYVKFWVRNWTCKYAVFIPHLCNSDYQYRYEQWSFTNIDMRNDLLPILTW